MPEEKMFTREEVSLLMKKRVERSHQSFFKRYGVKDLSELDALFDKANTVDKVQGDYDALKTQHDELEATHRDLTKKYAFKSRNINPDKVNDIETYYKGKGIDIDEATLDAELQTHPDWVQKTAGITEIGQETVDDLNSDVQERELASRLLGVEL